MPIDEFIAGIVRFYREHADHRDLSFRRAFLSLHDERFDGDHMGSGKVWRVAIPYIEGAEPVPEEFGCIHVPPILFDDPVLPFRQANEL